MGRANETSGKRELNLKRDKKRKEKEQKKLVKKETKSSKSFDDMIAYVDEFGNLSSTPKDLSEKEEINIEDIQINVPRRTEDQTRDIIRTGIVTFVDSSKGFGFIKDIETKQDVFVYLGNLNLTLKENNKVTFEVVKTQRGLNANNVKIVTEN
ncbi:MAG: cold shock domain-containing protein [Bacteroidales bacterium]